MHLFFKDFIMAAVMNKKRYISSLILLKIENACENAHIHISKTDGLKIGSHSLLIHSFIHYSLAIQCLSHLKLHYLFRKPLLCSDTLNETLLGEEEEEEEELVTRRRRGSSFDVGKVIGFCGK